MLVLLLFALVSTVGLLTFRADPKAVLWLVLAFGAIAGIFMLEVERKWIIWLLPALLGIVGFLKVGSEWLPTPLVESVEPSVEQRDKHDTLFVLVHGLSTSLVHDLWDSPEKRWDGVRNALRDYGDILVVRYPAFAVSNADPAAVARGISQAIQAAHDKQPYNKIILVGHSMGALLIRKAFLYASGGTVPPEGEARWADKVNRIVLLAGTNRGWDISGHRPLDMRWGRYLEAWFGTWLAQVTGTGRLLLAMENGAPFVADLRLEWMRWFRRPDDTKKPRVVQLLGDIDDVVSNADNKDLRASASAKFTWIRVRVTGHLDILDFEDPSSKIGEYRKAKFLLAAVNEDADVQHANDEQPFETDPEVKRIVFILHGIRDLGRWSAEFETALLGQFPRQTKDKLWIASIRYGYFAMGPFVLLPTRQKYVRWFMDEYTETLARYPEAKQIDFIGHSNGTYLLASALEQYRSLKVHRIVFAGSVVRTDYDWDTIFKNQQVEAVRNYKASNDWVVALFPRFFEQRAFRFLRNDLGSAGFNGFDSSKVDNVGFITGPHSAFLQRITSIVDFLNTQDIKMAARPKDEGCNIFLKWVSAWACWAVWLLIAFIIGWIGFHVAGAAREYALPVAAVYVALILWILHIV